MENRPLERATDGVEAQTEVGVVHFNPLFVSSADATKREETRSGKEGIQYHRFRGRFCALACAFLSSLIAVAYLTFDTREDFMLSQVTSLAIMAMLLSSLPFLLWRDINMNISFWTRAILVIAWSFILLSSVIVSSQTGHLEEEKDETTNQEMKPQAFCNTIIGEDDTTEYTLPCLNGRKRPFALHMRKNITKSLTLQEVNELGEKIVHLLGYAEDFAGTDGRCSLDNSTNAKKVIKYMLTVVCYTIFQPCDSTCRSYDLCSDDVCKPLYSKNSDCYLLGDVVKAGSYIPRLRSIISPNNEHAGIIESALGLTGEKLKSVWSILGFMMRFLDDNYDLEQCKKIGEFASGQEDCFKISSNKFVSRKKVTRGGNCTAAGLSARQFLNRAPPKPNRSVPVLFVCALGFFIIYFVATARYTTRALDQSRRRKPPQIDALARVKVAGTGILSVFVCVLLFSHSHEQESLYREKRKAEESKPIIPFYIPLYYALSVTFCYIFALQLVSVCSGKNAFETGTKIEKRSHSKWVIFFRQLRDEYYEMFGLNKGVFSFQKVILFEMVEIYIQVSSLDAISKDSNILFVAVAVALVSVNLIVVPVILILRNKMQNTALKLIALDTVFEIAYLWNNLARGGSGIHKLQNDFSVITAVMYPACFLGLRMQKISKAFMESKKRAAVSQFRLYLKRTESKFGSWFGKGKCCTRALDWVVLPFIIVFTTSVTCYAISQFIAVNRACETELTAALWNNAHPKKMFQGGIFSRPDCGYNKVKEIKANHVGISRIPSAIGQCVELRVLDLGYNRISSLPAILLKMNTLTKLKEVRLDGNPVERVLNISKEHFPEFPPKFVCTFMASTLVDVVAEFSGIDRINSCIGDFHNLERLSVAFNQIPPSGISCRILNLQNGVAIDVMGNPAYSKLSFHNCQIEEERAQSLVRILRRNFPSLLELDLSKNKIEKGVHFWKIIEETNELQILNISQNKIKTLFGSKANYSYFESRALSLQHIDASSNPELGTIEENVYRYFQQEVGNASITLQNVNAVVVLLINTDLKHFPSVVLDELTALELLTIRDNRNFKIPSNLTYFCRFKNLKHLFIQHATFVPPCIRSVESLTITGSENSTINFSWPFQLFMEPHTRVKKFIVARSHDLSENWKSLQMVDPGNRLEELVLADLKLTGNLPVRYNCTLPRLKQLSLHANNLNGPIPPWEFQRLVVLDLSDNLLSGQVPKSVIADNLDRLFLTSNPNLTGALPNLSENATLKCLDIRGTNITGIPKSYFNLSGELLFDFNASAALDARARSPPSTMECFKCNPEAGIGTVHPCQELSGNASKVMRIPQYVEVEASVKRRKKLYIWCKGKLFNSCGFNPQDRIR